MLVCQWHLDVPSGKQAAAVTVTRTWGAEQVAGHAFRRARETRLAGPGAAQLPRHSESLAPLIGPGSQRWVVYRVPDERRG